MQCDLLVVGSGIAGFSGSLEARSRGLSVVHTGIDRRAVCARLRRPAIAAALERFPAEFLRPTMARNVIRRVEAGVDDYVEQLQSHLRAAGVEIGPGEVRLVSETEVRVGDEMWHPRAVLIAGTSEPRHPGRFDFAEAAVLNPISALSRVGSLRSAVVVGAESDGCEIATILAAGGCQITLVDRRHRLLRAVDRDVLAVFHAALQSAGVELLLGESLNDVVVHTEGSTGFVDVSFGSGSRGRYEAIVVAAGRTACTTRFGLGEAGIATDGRDRVLIDDFGATSLPRIHASAETAGFEGTVAANWRDGVRLAIAATGGEICGDETDAPEITWATVPTMASVGLTQEACERLAVPHDIGIARFSDTLWGVGRCGRDGLLKLITEPGGEIIGAHAIGGGSLAIVGLAASWIRTHRTVREPGASIEPGNIEELFAQAAAGSTRTPERIVISAQLNSQRIA